MSERPILFSGAMVRALLAGTKTQTRRVVKPQPHILAGELLCWKDDALTDDQMAGLCPHGKPGDRLWVRETWARDDEDGALMYRADLGRDINADAWDRGRLEGVPRYRWRPSIHMPRWASRITLEITGVRVERLQDISAEDCSAEGIKAYPQPRGRMTRFGIDTWQQHYMPTDPREAYFSLLAEIHGDEGPKLTDWLWVVEFKRAGQ